MVLSGDRVVTIDLSVLFLADIHMLGHLGEVPVFIVEADSAGHGTVLRKCVVQLESDDAADPGLALA